MKAVTSVSIFVASPGDVAAERDAVQQAVDEFNDIGLGGGKVVVVLKRWETHAWPGFGEDAQDVINEQIGEFDIFIGIMWNRLGTRTHRSPSGTVEEFERAYEKWKVNRRPSLMFYFNTEPSNLSSEKELTQKKLVLRFQKSLKKLGALYWEYRGASEFGRLVRRHLFKEIERITAPSPAPQPDAKDPAVERVMQLGQKLGYWHAGATRQVLQEMAQATGSGSIAVREAIIRALLDFLGTSLPGDDAVVTASARDLRKRAFQVLRRCASADLRKYLANGAFESLDLFQIDFSRLDITQVSFNTAFLVEANFGGATLDGASFCDCWIRNADFARASLKGADLSGADWFNALSLTVEQIRDVKPGTLITPPKTSEAMHEYLNGRYSFPFESWRGEVQQALLGAWAEYLKPGGLIDMVTRA